MLSYKQSAEEVLIERTVKTTIEILYDKGLLDNYDNADEVLKHYLFAEWQRPDLNPINDNDDVFQRSFPCLNLKNCDKTQALPISIERKKTCFQ